jgi:RNA polymerase sigma-70 factor (ECF subfamily)
MRAGDTEAFIAIYARYYRLVYAIARRRLSEPDAVDDIVQSVFLSIWTSSAAFRGGSFPAWLTRLTQNRVLDAQRRRVARREAALPVELIAEECFEDVVHLRLLAERVRAALAALPEEQRSLIELGFFGERSHAELAILTRLPLGTVKTRIRTGLQKMRFSLAAAAGDEL